MNHQEGRDRMTPDGHALSNIELLQQTLLFKGCAKEEIGSIIGKFKIRQIKPGAPIFMEKMPAEAICFVKSGTVAITIMASEGDERGLLLLGPGEFFGELAVVQEDSRMVNARAESAVELLLLTRNDFQSLLDEQPRIAARMLMGITKLMALRLKANTEKLKEILLA